jgi:hypothetical protein
MGFPGRLGASGGLKSFVWVRGRVVPVCFHGWRLTASAAASGVTLTVPGVVEWLRQGRKPAAELHKSPQA